MDGRSKREVRRRAVALAVGAFLLSSGLGLAARPASAAPVLGGQLYGTGGEVTVTVLPHTAGLVSELRLCTPGYERFIALNTDTGTIVNLGSFPAGLELIFCIFVPATGRTYYMGPAERNPDGVIHATVDVLGPGQAQVGFEDLFGGGDRDYDDNNFSFTGVIPNPPPDCSAVTAGSSVLWPPNNKMRLITLTGATDPEGEAVTTTITGVTQDEQLDQGTPDAEAGPAGDSVYLRAERDGKGDGRVYRIAYTATDGSGGTCSGVVVVGVPHDQGSNGAPVDSGLAVDSFGG